MRPLPPPPPFPLQPVLSRGGGGGGVAAGPVEMRGSEAVPPAPAAPLVQMWPSSRPSMPFGSWDVWTSGVAGHPSPRGLQAPECCRASLVGSPKEDSQSYHLPSHFRSFRCGLRGLHFGAFWGTSNRFPERRWQALGCMSRTHHASAAPWTVITPSLCQCMKPATTSIPTPLPHSLDTADTQALRQQMDEEAKQLLAELKRKQSNAIQRLRTRTHEDTEAAVTQGGTEVAVAGGPPAVAGGPPAVA